MKIILIVGCSDCVHGAQWNLDKTEYMCKQLGKVSENPKKPLDDCPLQDALKVIRGFLKAKVGR